MENILGLIYQGITGAISIYSILLIIYILMSWIPASRETKFGIILGRLLALLVSKIRSRRLFVIVRLFALGFISDGVRAIFLIL